jgi:hypothetical protein
MLRERLTPRAEMCRSEISDDESAGRAARTGSTSIEFEQFVHFLARPESGQVLFRHQDVVAGTGIAPRARPALLGRENSESTELHPVETRERVGNFAEYRVNDFLDVALIQMWIARDEPLHQLGLNQDNAP